MAKKHSSAREHEQTSGHSGGRGAGQAAGHAAPATHQVPVHVGLDSQAGAAGHDGFQRLVDRLAPVVGQKARAAPEHLLGVELEGAADDGVVGGNLGRRRGLCWPGQSGWWQAAGRWRVKGGAWWLSGKVAGLRAARLARIFIELWQAPPCVWRLVFGGLPGAQVQRCAPGGHLGEGRNNKP